MGEYDHNLSKQEPILGKINSPRSHFTNRAFMSPVSWKMMCAVLHSSKVSPKYSGQIVFAGQYKEHYPSFWMSSVIGIIGAKVQKMILRVIALQVGLSNQIRGWVWSAVEQVRLSVCSLSAPFVFAYDVHLLWARIKSERILLLLTCITHGHVLLVVLAFPCNTTLRFWL